MERMRIWLQQFGLLVGIGVVGVGILAYGLWGVIVPEQPMVEIIKAGSQSSEHSLAQGSELKGQIKVDVAGAVEKPAVYTLPSSSRIGDAIVAAGGLSAQADREWVAKTLNLAQEVKDGGKIFIPSRNENNIPTNQRTNAATEKQSGLVNINTASVAELDKLVGIGEVRAQAIVANRPYSETHELVTKAKIPQSVYEKILTSISLY